MALVFLLGGARSGKSALAVDLAQASGRPVSLVATAEAGDEEMAARIAHHRAERAATWTTIEEPLDLGGTIDRVAPADCLVVDCLSLWVANRLELEDEPEAIEQQARRAAELVAGRSAPGIAVSNEVGLGIVPATPLGRRYRDVLGRVNAVWAAAAAEAFFVVAGRALRLERPRA